jgi:hypothetical protein
MMHNDALVDILATPAFRVASRAAEKLGHL